MPRLRVLSGRQVVRILHRFGFRVVAVRGSHAKLHQEVASGAHQTLTLPLHDTLAPGTVLAIYRQAVRLVPESDLRPHFYTDS